MQKIKNAIKGHKADRAGDRADEYDTTMGGTTYGGTSGAETGYGPSTVGHPHGTAAAGTGYTEGMPGHVVGEHPVAVGVAEVPVVVTEQERVEGTHGHHERTHGHHERTHGHHERIGEEVCGQKTFTEVEDRPVVRERVERIVEHRPVEKQYVVETRFVGEKEMGVAGAEIVDVKDRVVDVAAPGATCPVNTGAVMNEVISGVQGTGTGVMGGHHHTGHHHTTDRI